MAYGIIMPALYAPIIAMLLALVFRGVAFEFRWRTKRWIRHWDRAFIGGSVMAAFAQGVALGALLQGIDVDGRAYGGGWWDWLSPFSLLTGVAVVVGYGLLGATWLVMKLEGDIQERARKFAWQFGLGAIGFIVLVSVFTPFLENAYFERWLTMPGIIFAAPVPLAVAGFAFAMFKSLNVHKHEYRPFILALGLFFVTYVGLGISIYPYIIPTEVTILDAATPFGSQIFMFVGAVILIPIILAYTGYAYWVFRGKMDPAEGYH
jgi:cytochrome d ubiquinol oxidase subunit II